jgi:quercetin dioxygenase-like cupin family protein
MNHWTKLPDADDLAPAAEQPYGVELHMADDVFVKQMAIPRKGTYVPQHSHVYGHTSMLAKGSIRVWKDGVLDRDYAAPTGLFIEAGVKHTFLSLEDDTVVYCIHNLSRSEVIQVLEENGLV